VQPGRYRVRVKRIHRIRIIDYFRRHGFAAPAALVGLGGATPPIEITVRDDGAQVEGTI